MMAMKSWDLMMEVQIYRFEIFRYLPQEKDMLINRIQIKFQLSGHIFGHERGT